MLLLLVGVEFRQFPSQTRPFFTFRKEVNRRLKRTAAIRVLAFANSAIKIGDGPALEGYCDFLRHIVTMTTSPQEISTQLEA